jgi:putative membrane protein
MNGMGGFMFPGFGLIIIILLVIFVVWLVGGGRFGSGAGGHSTGDHNRSETPLEILKRRYARGEITKEEFDNIKKDLQS